MVKLVFNRSIGWNIQLNKKEENMIVTQKIWNGADCYKWRKTFAIWPVKTISGKYVWLKSVYKQKYWAVWGTGFHMEPEVEYGDLFDVLTYEYND